MGLRDRRGDPRAPSRLVRGRVGPGAEPQAARRRAARNGRGRWRTREPSATGCATACGRASLVFLAARIGLSLVPWSPSTSSNRSPPVDVPGRTAPAATSGLAQRDRCDRAAGCRLVPAARRRRVVGGRRQRRLLPSLSAHGSCGRVDASRLLARLWPGDELLAALLVSNVAFLGALLALFALTADAFGERVARRAIVVAALFPTAFFFLAPYTESLFLFLSILAFRAARHDRWGRVAVSGALAALTRSVGHPADPGPPGGGVLGEARPQRLPPGARRSRRRARPRSPWDRCRWFAWWGLAHGNWLAPLDAQRQWGRELQPPWVSLAHAVDLAWSFRSYWLLDLVLVSLAIAGLALAAARAPRLRDHVRSPEPPPPARRPLLGPTAPIRSSIRRGGVPRALGPVRRRARACAPSRPGDRRARGWLGALRRALRELATPVLRRTRSEPASVARGRMCRARDRPEVS